MKDWDYYEKPKDIQYFGYDYQRQYKESEIEKINNTRLTTPERVHLISKLDQQIRDHMREKNAPYNAACAKLTKEFWEDARRDIGYAEHLTPQGISRLESKAYEDGHPYGYSEIYSNLRELWYFVSSMVLEYLP